MGSVDVLPAGMLAALQTLAVRGGSHRLDQTVLTVAPEQGLVLLFPLLPLDADEIAARCTRAQLEGGGTLCDVQVAINARGRACLCRRIAHEEIGDDLALQQLMLPMLQLVRDVSSH